VRAQRRRSPRPNFDSKDCALNEIVLGKRAVTAETAVLMGELAKTNPRLWLHLQADYDLWHALKERAR